jgi:hypothetical protein
MQLIRTSTIKPRYKLKREIENTKLTSLFMNTLNCETTDNAKTHNKSVSKNSMNIHISNITQTMANRTSQSGTTAILKLNVFIWKKESSSISHIFVNI